jgi:hypothetical protein
MPTIINESDGRQPAAMPTLESSMRILFIADPLEQFKIYKDTTFAMMEEAARRGHAISHAQARTSCRWKAAACWWMPVASPSPMSARAITRPGTSWMMCIASR